MNIQQNLNGLLGMAAIGARMSGSFAKKRNRIEREAARKNDIEDLVSKRDTIAGERDLKTKALSSHFMGHDKEGKETGLDFSEKKLAARGGKAKGREQVMRDYIDVEDRYSDVLRQLSELDYATYGKDFAAYGEAHGQDIGYSKIGEYLKTLDSPDVEAMEKKKLKAKDDYEMEKALTSFKEEEADKNAMDSIINRLDELTGGRIEIPNRRQLIIEAEEARKNGGKR